MPSEGRWYGDGKRERERERKKERKKERKAPLLGVWYLSPEDEEDVDSGRCLHLCMYFHWSRKGAILSYLLTGKNSEGMCGGRISEASLEKSTLIGGGGSDEEERCVESSSLLVCLFSFNGHSISRSYGGPAWKNASWAFQMLGSRQRNKQKKAFLPIPSSSVDEHLRSSFFCE